MKKWTWNYIESDEDLPQEGEYIVATYDGEMVIAELDMDGKWIFRNGDISDSVFAWTEKPEFPEIPEFE